MPCSYPSAPRQPTDRTLFASASRLWPFWEQPKCLHCDYICRFLICPRESTLRIEERVTTSGLRRQTSSAMSEVTEAMARVFGACLWWSDRMDVVCDDCGRQSDLWMIPICSLLLAFGVFSTLDLYPSSPSSRKIQYIFLFIIILNFRVNFVM